MVKYPSIACLCMTNQNQRFWTQLSSDIKYHDTKSYLEREKVIFLIHLCCAAVHQHSFLNEIQDLKQEVVSRTEMTQQS